MQAWWERIYFPRSNNYVWALHGKFHDQLVKDLKGNARAYSALNPVGPRCSPYKAQPCCWAAALLIVLLPLLPPPLPRLLGTASDAPQRCCARACCVGCAR